MFFSANGAAFTRSLGQRPRIVVNPRTPALKARFTSRVMLRTHGMDFDES
jgi:hypothetical protein